MRYTRSRGRIQVDLECPEGPQRLVRRRLRDSDPQHQDGDEGILTHTHTRTHTHKKKVSRYPQLQTLPHSSRDSINTAPADHPCSHHTVDQDLTKKDQQKKLRTNWQYNKVKKKVS